MKIQVTFENSTFDAEAQNIRGVLWVHVQGRTFIYESESQKKRARSKSAAGATGLITSPMPGKVTKILKVVGDIVSTGDAILVMEAMKMEYTLKADINGKLKILNCKVGEQVALGKKLAQIEAEPG
jgi:acetyl/propionyl-CoA carboxylase alpha subunit